MQEAVTQQEYQPAFEPTLALEPMSIGALLGNTVRLFGRLLPRTGVVAVLLLIPSFLFTGAMLRGFLSTLVVLLRKYGIPEQNAAPEVMRAYSELVGPLMLVFIGYVVLIFTCIYVQTLATMESWNQAEPRFTTFSEILAAAIKRPFLFNLVQSMLVLTIFFMGMIVTSLVSSGFAAVLTSVVGGVMVAVFLIGLLYFAIATIFRVHEIVADDRGPWRGLIASMALVKKHWIRVGALLLLLVGICIGVSVLVNYAVMGTTTKNFVTAGTTDAMVTAAQYQQLLSVMTIPYFIVQGILASLFLVFAVSFLTPLYGDLRVRRGDFVFVPDGKAPPVLP